MQWQLAFQNGFVRLGYRLTTCAASTCMHGLGTADGVGFIEAVPSRVATFLVVRQAGIELVQCTPCMYIAIARELLQAWVCTSLAGSIISPMRPAVIMHGSMLKSSSKHSDLFGTQDRKNT